MRDGGLEREREREGGNFNMIYMYVLLLLLVQIIILRRLSSQQIRFDWYDQFCGGATDGETLLTMLNHMHGPLKRTAFLSYLLDEEAPVIIITV